MQKVMRAMNMIASIKLHKLLRIQGAIQIFSKSLKDLRDNIARSLHHLEVPLVTGYKNEKKIHVVIFTADKGLCGSHNSTIKKATEMVLEKNKSNSIESEVTCIGKKGALFCGQKGYPVSFQTEIHERTFSTDALMQVSGKILNSFLQGSVQRIITIYNRFVSTIHQETLVDQVLPFSGSSGSGEKEKGFTGYTEPKETAFIGEAAKLYLFYELQAALFNSRLSEQAARMTAMENATNNSEDLISRYARARNRVRQTAITNELIEIISGKEALKRK